MITNITLSVQINKDKFEKTIPINDLNNKFVIKDIINKVNILDYKK